MYMFGQRLKTYFLNSNEHHRVPCGILVTIAPLTIAFTYLLTYLRTYLFIYSFTYLLTYLDRIPFTVGGLFVDCEMVIEPPCQLNVPPSRSSSDVDLQLVRTSTSLSIQRDNARFSLCKLSV